MKQPWLPTTRGLAVCCNAPPLALPRAGMKMYQKEIDGNQNKICNIETIALNIEQAVMNADVVDAMAQGRDAQASLNARNDPDKVADVMDDIAEQQQMAAEVSDMLSGPIGGEMFDEDDCEAELDEIMALQTEEDMMNLPAVPSTLHAEGKNLLRQGLDLPAAPTGGVRLSNDDDEAALRELEAAMM